MTMHAAKLENSPRLQRVLRLLTKAKKPLTTMQISRMANVMAVSACVSELRHGGTQIACKRTGDYWYYRLGE